MSSLLLGIAAACAASSLYDIGLALQALDARDAPADEGLRPSLLARLIRRPRWLIGTGLNLAGWPLQAVALLLAPLTVVQPALAFGLVLLLFIGIRHLDERVGLREVAAVAAILTGVALLGLVAPDVSTQHAGTRALACVLGGVAVLALVPFALRGRGSVTTLGAGAALAWSGLSTKLAADALHQGHVQTALLWAIATGVASGIGLLAEMSALQQRAATQVAPVVFVVQVVVPVLAAPVLVGEWWAGWPCSSAARWHCCARRPCGRWSPPRMRPAASTASPHAAPRPPAAPPACGPRRPCVPATRRASRRRCRQPQPRSVRR